MWVPWQLWSLLWGMSALLSLCGEKHGVRTVLAPQSFLEEQNGVIKIRD